MRSQGVTEELKCLSLLNALHKDPDIPEQLAQLLGEPCMKLAEGIKAYISKVRGTGTLRLSHGEDTWRTRGSRVRVEEHLGGMMQAGASGWDSFGTGEQHPSEGSNLESSSSEADMCVQLKPRRVSVPERAQSTI